MNTDTVKILEMNGATASDNLDKLELKCRDNNVHVNKNVKNISNICRICATVTDLVIPIFEGEGLQNYLADKIHEHLPIQVSEQDVLPRVVCYQCSSTLLAWHELVQCCRQADHAMRQSATTNRWQTGKKINDDINLLERKSDSKSLSLITEIVRSVLIEYCHMLNINEENSDLGYVCQECVDQPLSNSIENLSQHLQTAHITLNTKRLIVNFIKENVTIEEKLDFDEAFCDTTPEKCQTQKEIPNYFCPFCESVFSSPTRLIFHLNTHIEVCIDDGVFCCEQLYTDKISFVSHLQAHHVRKVTEASHACKSCGLTADDLGELQNHIIKMHPEELDKYEKGKAVTSPKCQKFIPAVCPECNKTFSNKYNMLVHMRNHFGESSKFACDKCTKSYKSQGSLLSHRRVVHEGQLRFVCSSCGEAFPSRGARDVHARLHSGARPFACHYCGKAYRAKNTLDRHVEMHLNIRKYACHFCDKKFRKSTHLKYHLRTHEKKT